MKSKKLKGLISIAVVGAILSTITPVKAYAEWTQDSQSNWAWTEDGGSSAIGWKQIDGTWYHFNESGTMQTGWVKAEDSKWYYMNSDGSMKTGWLKDTDGKWYDLAPSGEMKTGWTQDTDGKQYFLSSSGSMQTGVVDVDGKEYALDASGAKLIGTNVVCESNQYTTDANGVITLGNNASNVAKKFTNEGVPIVPTATTASSTGTTATTDTTTTETSSSSGSSSSHHHSSSSSTTPVTPTAPIVPIATLVDGSTNATATIEFSEELYWKDGGNLIKNVDFDMMTLPKSEVPFKVVDFAGKDVDGAIKSAVYSATGKNIVFKFDSTKIKSNGYKLKFLGKNYDAAGNALVVPSDNVVATYEGSTWTTKPSDPPKASLADNSSNTTATINFSEELYWNNNGVLAENNDFDMMNLGDNVTFKVVNSDDNTVSYAIKSAKYSASNKKIVFIFDSSKIEVGSKLEFLGENYDVAGNALEVPNNSVVANFDGTNWTTKPVSIPVKGVTLDETSLNLKPGHISCLSASITPKNATNKAVEWTSSNNTVATVDKTGKVTAVGNGTTVITATTVDGSATATCLVTVKASISVTEVILNKSTLSLQQGQCECLSASIMPIEVIIKSVEWSSSNNTVATVDKTNGKVTAVGNGTTVITAAATTDKSKFAKCTVTVTAAPAKISSIAVKDAKTVVVTLSKAQADLTIQDFGVEVFQTSNSSRVINEISAISAGDGNTTYTLTLKDNITSGYYVAAMSNVRILGESYVKVQYVA